jgi:hypothetical protein
MLRRPEAELVTRIRDALGTSRFEQAFVAGSRLGRHEAAAVVRDWQDAGARGP